MPKPLEVTYWMRFKQLLRGLVFYNTVDWKRASDGLNPPKLTLAERKSYMPPRNLDVIKPREQPRAHIDEATRRQRRNEREHSRLSMPPRIASAQLAAMSIAKRPANPIPGVSSRGGGTPAGKHRMSPPPGVKIRRRRKRRSRSSSSDEQPPSPGLFARLLIKWMS